MKKNIKPIIISAAAALSFGALAVGSTFALFTSKANTTIEVNSGIVNVEQSLQIQSVAELGNIPVSPVDGVYTNSIGGKTYVDEDNSNILHLDKWAPGDKAVVELRNVNKSNVTIRSRFATSHSSSSTLDLYDALNVSYVAYDKDGNDITYLVDEWTTYAPAENIETGYLLNRVEVTIEFPDGDDGAILFGDENHDNQYQNCNTAIYFTQEAVQGNAYTPSLLDIINEALESSAQVNGTMYDALNEVGLDADIVYHKHYVWNALEDQFYLEDSVTPSTNYFKVYKEMPTDPDFSIYADGWTEPSIVNLDGVGFDAGDVSIFTDINYVNTSGNPKTNTIRSNNGGTTTINAATDVVHHYGILDNLHIIAIAGESYHEFGFVRTKASIAQGRLVVEEPGNIPSVEVTAVPTENAPIKIVTDKDIAVSASAEVKEELAGEKLDYLDLNVNSDDATIAIDDTVNIDNIEINDTPATEEDVEDITVVDNLVDLKGALNAGKAYIRLSDNISFSSTATNSAICGNHSVTIDGDGHYIYGYGKRGSNFTTMYFQGTDPNAKLDVKLVNLDLTSSAAGGRPLETRGNVNSLVLENCNVNALVTGGTNNQGITIGGSQAETTNVVIDHSDITINKSGYGLITFNPVNLLVKDSNFAGYCALYFKGVSGSAGSKNSTAVLLDSYFDCASNLSGSTNNFGAFVFEDEDISLTVSGCTVDVTEHGLSSQAAIVFNGAYADPNRFGNDTVSFYDSIIIGKILICSAPVVESNTISIYSGVTTVNPTYFVAPGSSVEYKDGFYFITVDPLD